MAVVSFGACEEKTRNVPKEEAAVTIATELCGQADRCGCFEVVPSTAEMCKMMYESQWQSIVDAGTEAGLSYDGECVGKLLDVYGSLECRTQLDEGDIGQFADCSSCKFFYGSKQAGEPCALPPDGLSFAGDECAQGLQCDGEQCFDPCATAGEGESCLDVECAEGLVCQSDIDPETNEPIATCVRAPGEGEPCPDFTCADGLTCDLGDPVSMDPPTCIRPAAEGEDCSQVACDDELTCDPESNTCVPWPSAGQPCPMGFCDEASYCDMSDPDQASWVCVARKGDGEPCESDDECASWYCGEEGCGPEIPIVCDI